MDENEVVVVVDCWSNCEITLWLMLCYVMLLMINYALGIAICEAMVKLLLI